MAVVSVVSSSSRDLARSWAWRASSSLTRRAPCHGLDRAASSKAPREAARWSWRCTSLRWDTASSTERRNRTVVSGPGSRAVSCASACIASYGDACQRGRRECRESSCTRSCSRERRSASWIASVAGSAARSLRATARTRRWATSSGLRCEPRGSTSESRPALFQARVNEARVVRDSPSTSTLRPRCTSAPTVATAVSTAGVPTGVLTTKLSPCSARSTTSCWFASRSVSSNSSAGSRSSSAGALFCSGRTTGSLPTSGFFRRASASTTSVRATTCSSAGRSCRSANVETTSWCSTCIPGTSTASWRRISSTGAGSSLRVPYASRDISAVASSTPWSSRSRRTSAGFSRAGPTMCSSKSLWSGRSLMVTGASSTGAMKRRSPSATGSASHDAVPAARYAASRPCITDSSWIFVRSARAERTARS